MTKKLKNKLPETPFETVCWMIIGSTGADFGTLTFDGKRLIFKTDNQKLSFNIPIQELTALKFPWYNFGAAFKGSIPGRKIYMSFVAPVGAIDPDNIEEDVLLPTGAGFLSALHGLRSLKLARKRMAGWKQIFKTNNIK